jgi:pyruvate formate lyase activating enzyme
MVIGGFRKFSLIDFPGKTCAIIYTRGCDLRCPYCHNPELVLPEQYAPEIPVEDVLGFLQKRQGLLEAVTITGGEPTLHDDLGELIGRIKELGFAVKLDTNGGRPQALKALLDVELLDYIAMDLKAPLGDYARAAGREIPADVLRESIKLIMGSGIDYEFRTTVDRSLLGEDDLLEMAASIRGARKYYLQQLNRTSEKHVGICNELPDDEAWLMGMAELIKPFVELCGVR